MRLADQLRRACADFVLLYGLPAFVALLPWRIGFELLKRVARGEWVHREATQAAWLAARDYLPGADEAQWKRRFRLIRLVDHADVYLALLRRSGWRARYIDEQGEWPSADKACMFLTYHWGAGWWVWPRLRELGFDARFLARRAQGRALGLTRLSHWFGGFREWALHRAGAGGVVFTGRSSGEVQATLRSGRSLVGMLDLPAQPQQRAVDATLLDRRVRLPSGLAHRAHDAAVEIALFSVGLDFDSGRRTLRIERMPAGLSVDEIMRRYTAHLDARLREAPELWQIWIEAPAMFLRLQ